MERLEVELDRARDLDVAALADAIESIGFECTRCGACCKAGEASCASDAASGERRAEGSDPHTATVFPDEVRDLLAAASGDGPDYDWRDVARPMPYGLTAGADGPEGETFEWALQTDACGDCAFYEESSETTHGGGETAGETEDGTGTCTVHADRPLICRTYPFSVALGGTSQPMGEAVDEDGIVRAHECEGLGRDIAREDAEAMARTLKERATREIEEAIAVRDSYDPVETGPGEVVVHDSEGAKRPDGTPVDDAG